MKTHNEHPRSTGMFPATKKDQQKLFHDVNTRQQPGAFRSNMVFTKNVKTGFWKTYNVRNSGKK